MSFGLLQSILPGRNKSFEQWHQNPDCFPAEDIHRDPSAPAQPFIKNAITDDRVKHPLS